jgi:ferredoxin-NADP reductase
VLLGLGRGDVVHATSIGGDFIPPRDPTVPVLLIAAGVGITPFLAHLSDTGAGTRDTTVLYLAQSNKHLAYAQALETSGARVIARLADSSAPPRFMEDAGTERIDHRRLQSLIPDISSRHVYISGSPASVESLRSASRKAGARRISIDSFAGY